MPQGRHIPISCHLEAYIVASQTPGSVCLIIPFYAVPKASHKCSVSGDEAPLFLLYVFGLWVEISVPCSVHALTLGSRKDSTKRMPPGPLLEAL